MPKHSKASQSAIRKKVRQSPLPGQHTLEKQPMKSLHLPDKIPDDVHTLFVGINPGIRSATIGHYYAGHSNYFWKLLYASGIWPTPITTEQDDEILLAGYGLTDVAKRPTPGSSALSRSDFIASKERLYALVRHYRPRTVVLVGKTAIRSLLPDPRQPLTYGLQKWNIEGAHVFLVPSTSGASLADTSYAQKLKHFKQLKKHISSYYSSAR